MTKHKFQNSNPTTQTLRQRLFERAQETYGVKDYNEYNNLLKYHSQVRSQLNKDFAAALVSEVYEQGDSNISKGVKMGSKLLGMVPGVGSIAQSFFDGAVDVGESFRKGAKNQEYKNMCEFFPSSDPEEFAKFSKMIATELLDRKSDKIKNLTREELAEEIKRDSKKILKLIKSGEYKDIITSDLSSQNDLEGSPDLQKLLLKGVVEELVDHVAEGKKTQHKTSNSEQKGEFAKIENSLSREDLETLGVLSRAIRTASEGCGKHSENNRAAYNRTSPTAITRH